MSAGDLQADQRAGGITDKTVQARDAQRIQQCGDCIGLVGGVDRRIQAAVGPEEIEGQQSARRGIQRAAGTDQPLYPTFLGKYRAGSEMAMG